MTCDYHSVPTLRLAINNSSDDWPCIVLLHISTTPPATLVHPVVCNVQSLPGMMSTIKHSRRHIDAAIVCFASLLHVILHSCMSDAALCLTDTNHIPVEITNTDQITAEFPIHWYLEAILSTPTRSRYQMRPSQVYNILRWSSYDLHLKYFPEIRIAICNKIFDIPTYCRACLSITAWNFLFLCHGFHCLQQLHVLRDADVVIRSCTVKSLQQKIVITVKSVRLGINQQFCLPPITFLGHAWLLCATTVGYVMIHYQCNLLLW